MVKRFFYFRVYLIALLLLFCFVSVGVRHLYLVTRQAEFLVEQSSERTKRNMQLKAQRGAILDRNRIPLSVNLPAYRLKIYPKQVKDPADVKKLKQVLGKSHSIEKLLNASQNFVYVPGTLTRAQVKQLTQLQGVEIEEVSNRYYPFSHSTSAIVGVLGREWQGLLGLEYQFNDWLTGTDGSMQYTQNLLHQVHTVHAYHKPVVGGDLLLTLDTRLQQLGYQILANAVDHHDAKSASAVILEVETGDVLAMLNYPSFNPNIRLSKVDEHTKNKSISNLFEPGSIIKPLAMASILSHQYYKPNYMIETSAEGHLVGSQYIKDHKYLGVLKFEDVLVKSSNIAMIKLTEQLPDDYLVNTYHKMGLFTSSYLPLYGENVGKYLKVSDANKLTMSYGYGLAVNLMSMARAYNIIANKGLDVGLHLLLKGNRVRPEAVLSEDVTQYITQLMTRVTKYGVSSRSAAIEGVSVAGKSGTTHTLSEYGKYEDEYIASFAGFAPSNNPKIVIAVMVERPRKNGHYGGQVAAPIFAKLLHLALSYYDSKEGTYVRGEGALSGTTVGLADKAGL
ncbi:penicillin-binding protein 2 [Candidatus Comchoanobacter bicostacola]|uniref:Penicillin-binding protein 2 n=1 Tax=Candidatus Comchoanobacter bicostacola TaxID=2919598 RepID=A0ABY5DKI8_9GAMM|nr:penicillin-binding protein 2 [Candidatus Comchoanobacter bicostacola]UTC24244.1 penicillin-binding protein 2 [Candidatus Comchoanobacter bicostacola]